jgi:hypothetical protein
MSSYQHCLLYVLKKLPSRVPPKPHRSLMLSLSNPSGTTVLIRRYWATCEVLGLPSSQKLITQTPTFVFQVDLVEFSVAKEHSGICLHFPPLGTYGLHFTASINVP